jgi:type I restriction enzyme S subunit
MIKWKTVKWEEVLTIKNGKNQKKVNNPNGKYPIYGSGGIMGRADDFLCTEGTTVIGRKGSINNPIYVLEKFWNVDTAFGLSPGEGLDSKFFYYFCTTYNFLKHNKATTLPSLTKADLLKIEITIPPLMQQQKIAAILDAADALRQTDKALIAKYDELTQALFLDMFGDPVSNPKGWVENSLKDLCNKITDGTHDTPLRLTEGIKFITGKHIRPFVIDYENSDYVTEEVHNEIYRRCNPEHGDILYTNIGVNFATAAMNIVDYEFSMKNVALLKYKREFLNGRFLESILNNEFFKDRLKRAFGIGGAQQFLSLSNIKSIMVLCPPLELQNQFAERVAVIEQQKAIAQAGLEKSEELFNSLLQKAFKGELV